MTYSRPERITIRRTRIRRGRVAALLAVIAAAAAALGHQSPESAPSTASSSTAAPPALPAVAEELPGLAKLDAALRRAVRGAARGAASDGVRLRVNSGWRSAEEQERLRRAAVAKYGSQAEAARWVATAETSPHVSGDAVDIGPAAAAAWLSARGAEYGLCQIYANEPWHFELRPAAKERGCPPMYPDPTHDPRMTG